MRKSKQIVFFFIFLFGILMIPKDRAWAASYDYSSQVTMLQAIDYRSDATILNLLAPTYYTSAEKFAKKQEIASREGKNVNSITDGEAVKELQQEYVVGVYGESFTYVQSNMNQILKGMFDNLIPPAGNSPLTLIDNNSRQFLVGLVYLDRMYDFQMGSQNIRDVLYYHPDSYGKSTSQIELMIYIANAGANNLSIASGVKMFGSGKVFTRYVTSATTLNGFLEENRRKYASGLTLNEWFLQACPAYVEERGTSGLYSRLWADTSLQGHILPLLNLSQNSLYIIANPATITYGTVDCYVDRSLKTSNPSRYQTQLAEFKKNLKYAADQQYEFILLWQRIGKPELRSLLSTNRIVIDSMMLYSDDPYASASSRWSAKYGSQAALGIREFLAPLSMYTTYMFMDGEASGSGIRMYVATALTDRGLCTYNHEMTHQLVSTVMLNNHGIRYGMGAEVYTRGMLESYEADDPPAISMNFVFDFTNKAGRLQNAKPQRFQTEKDLQRYMRGILDVIYTLDYAEANAILDRSAEDKQKWFHKLTEINDTATRYNSGGAGYVHQLDQVSALTLAEAGQLNSIEDLIDHSMISSRYEVLGTTTTGTVASNGYYVVPLFSSNYAAAQNDAGVSGDIMIRRQAFELLAEYGYYEGLVPYMSNQYSTAAANDGTVLSDTYILNKIFNGKYSSMADFKKAMFRERMDKTDRLKPVTITWQSRNITISSFDTLNQLMAEAVESDLHTNIVNIRAQNTQVEQLKKTVYQAYLSQTSDFRTSIYEGETFGMEDLPNTYAKSHTDSFIALFCVMAVLTTGAYGLKRRYDRLGK